jgi:hypothetical protein
MRVYIEQGFFPTICHWLAALGRPGRCSILFGAARTFSEAANKATGFWGTNSDPAEHDMQDGLVIRVTAHECHRAPAPSFNADSRTIRLRRKVSGD